MLAGTELGVGLVVVVVVGLVVVVVVGLVVVVVGLVVVVVGLVVVGAVVVVGLVGAGALSTCVSLPEKLSGDVVCVSKFKALGDRKSVLAMLILATLLDRAKGTFLINVHPHAPLVPE